MSNISDNAFKPRRGGDTWRGADAEIYPPKLNRRIAIAAKNAAAAWHVARATLMYGAPMMSDEAVNKLADRFAEAHKINGATGLQTCVASFLDSVAPVDRHEDDSLDDADYQDYLNDTPIAGGGQSGGNVRSREATAQPAC